MSTLVAVVFEDEITAFELRTALMRMHDEATLREALEKVA
jgi:hypothetical protein